jgi:hypothetical protein
MQEAADELQGRQADIFDYICERWVLGQFPVTSKELQNVGNCNLSKVNRALRALEKKCLVRQEGKLDPLVAGGRPELLWVPNEASGETGGTRGTRETTSRASHEIEGYSPYSPYLPNTPGTSAEGVKPPLAGTPVELHRNGDWNNGWVVSDASDLHAVKAAKLGSPNVTVGSLRWGLDVRPCESSPFKADPVEPDPFDF